LHSSLDLDGTSAGEINADGTTDPADDSHVTLPAGSLNVPVELSSLTLRNTGSAPLDVDSLTGLDALVDCLNPGTSINPSSLLPIHIEPNSSVTLTALGCVIVTCPGTSLSISAHAIASDHDNTGALCVFDKNGVRIGDSTSNPCIASVGCATVVTCRVTGGGTLYNGDKDTDCVVLTTTLFPLSSGGVPLNHISHGGQLGAPFSQMDCGEKLANPCIRGQWQHTRHFVGKANPRDVFDFDFHSNTPKGLYDTLDCACLGCCNFDDVNQPNGKFNGAHKFVLCNPDDHKVCGPQPRPAPANAIIFTGIGTVKPATDAGVNNQKGEWVVFRVYIEDRSEPGGFFPKGAIEPSDVYCFQAWKTGILIAKKSDGNALGDSPKLGNVNAFRTALGVASCQFIQSLCTPEQIVNNVPGACVPPGTLPSSTVADHAADINDCGPLHSGNHQIHPSTGATCTQ